MKTGCSEISWQFHFMRNIILCLILALESSFSFLQLKDWNERYSFLENFEVLDENNLQFLLDIDGISVSSGREHVCAIEQNPMLEAGSRVGGNVQCWGIDYFGRLDAPRDVY